MESFPVGQLEKDYQHNFSNSKPTGRKPMSGSMRAEARPKMGAVMRLDNNYRDVDSLSGPQLSSLYNGMMAAGL